MVAGADSIDDMALLQHGGMSRIFARAYAPSTLGSFLRAFTLGHVRQLDAIASRFLITLAGLTQLLGPPSGRTRFDVDPDADPSYALLDVDDTIIEVHGHAKQGAGFGYSGAHGLSAPPGHARRPGGCHIDGTGDRGPAAPQQLSRVATGCEATGRRRGEDRATVAGKSQLILVRMDSAFYGRGPIHAALAGGAAVSVTVRMDRAVKKAIGAIDDATWTTIE